MFLMSGLLSFSSACSQAIIWPVSSAAAKAGQGNKHIVNVTLCKPPHRSCVYSKQHTHVKGLPHNLAVLGCGASHWSCNHFRLHEKGQGYCWFLSDLSVGEYVEAASPAAVTTACVVLKKSPLSSL